MAMQKDLGAENGSALASTSAAEQATADTKELEEAGAGAAADPAQAMDAADKIPAAGAGMSQEKQQELG